MGCNKGIDAVRTARMGTMDPAFDDEAYERAMADAGVDTKTACRKRTGRMNVRPEAQQRINVDPARTRFGRQYCVEPVANSLRAIEDARSAVGIDASRLVTTLAAISSKDGTVEFPNGGTGREYYGMDAGCDDVGCMTVPTYTLDTYVERMVEDEGPVNVLSIDTEGHDFDVLFGATSTLDRTHFLEFEYHRKGPWVKLHLQDVVRVLDGKGERSVKPSLELSAN